MATESFTKEFVLNSEEAVQSFLQAMDVACNWKIDRSLTSTEKLIEGKQKLLILKLF